MKFEELKKSLVNGDANKLYLLTGKDLFLMDNAYRLIFDSLHIDMVELNEIKFVEQEVDFNLVINALNTPAVFSDNKIVFVDLSSKYTKIRSIDTLKDYIKLPDFYNTLIIRIGENVECLKSVDLAKFTSVDCDTLSRDIAIKLITNEVKKRGKVISLDAINEMLDYTNIDLMSCMNEILKLVNYVAGEITIEHVRELVNKTLDYKIYELTEALAKKNVSKVYEILADLKHKKTGYQGLVGLIYTHFRRLLHMAINKCSVAEFADLFGIKEYAVRKAMEQVKYFTPKKLKQINDTCMALEYQVKTSQITPINAVDMLVLQILQ